MWGNVDASRNTYGADVQIANPEPRHSRQSGWGVRIFERRENRAAWGAAPSPLRVRLVHQPPLRPLGLPLLPLVERETGRPAAPRLRAKRSGARGHACPRPRSPVATASPVALAPHPHHSPDLCRSPGRPPRTNTHLDIGRGLRIARHGARGVSGPRRAHRPTGLESRALMQRQMHPAEDPLEEKVRLKVSTGQTRVMRAPTVVAVLAAGRSAPPSAPS